MGIAKLQNIKSYILAGKLLHIITLLEILATLIIIPYLYSIESESLFGVGLKYYAILYLISLPIFSQLDARSRFQNYKQIKDQIYIYGFKTKILKPILKSRCQRDAAHLSATELGFKKECENYFQSFGYKWYHLTPDFLFRKPQFLLTRYFWKTTFFTPTYTSKINYLENNAKLNFETNARTANC